MAMGIDFSLKPVIASFVFASNADVSKLRGLPASVNYAIGDYSGDYLTTLVGVDGDEV